MGAINGFNHVALATGDMNRTVVFYRDVLGLKVKATVGAGGKVAGTLAQSEPHGRLYFFELGATSTLAFVEVPGFKGHERSMFSAIWPGKGRPLTQVQKMDHLALNVDSLRELRAVQRKMRAAGVQVSDIQELKGSPFVKSIYFYDPNGIPLEISTWAIDDPAWRSRTKRDMFTDPKPVPAMNRSASTSRARAR